MESKKTASSHKPAHTMQCGEVTVRIHRRQSNAGFTYYDFSLARSWRSIASGKETHGSTFFAAHEQDLLRAVQEAAAWLREQAGSPASGGTPQSAVPREKRTT